MSFLFVNFFLRFFCSICSVSLLMASLSHFLPSGTCLPLSFPVLAMHRFSYPSSLCEVQNPGGQFTYMNYVLNIYEFLDKVMFSDLLEECLWSFSQSHQYNRSMSKALPPQMEWQINRHNRLIKKLYGQTWWTDLYWKLLTL